MQNTFERDIRTFGSEKLASPVVSTEAKSRRSGLHKRLSLNTMGFFYQDSVMQLAQASSRGLENKGDCQTTAWIANKSRYLAVMSLMLFPARAAPKATLMSTAVNAAADFMAGGLLIPRCKL